MSYTLNITLDFGSLTGLTLNGKLHAANGSQTGPTITTGFVEIANGIYSYLATIPDGHVGTLVAYKSTDATIKVAVSINPQEVENADAKTTSRLSTEDYTTPPSAVAISTQVAADLALAHGAGSWLTGSGISISDILSATVPASYAIGTVGYNLGRLSTGRVTVSSIIAASGKVSVVQGDDYSALDGRSLDFVGDDPNQWPDLTGASVYLYVSDGTLTVVGSVVTPTGTQRVRFEPTSVQTLSLPEGDYDFTIVSELSNGHKATLVRDILHVSDTEGAA